ncbi:MAG: NlpC/P60 family protein [Firmicutes bacterium]|nr:NlpC/P60 family protein [Bacillota bacterium]
MKRFAKTILTLSIGVALSVAPSAFSSASTLSQEQQLMNQLVQEANRTNAQIAVLQGQTVTYQAELRQDQHELADVAAALFANHVQSEQTKKRIAKLQAAILVKERQIAVAKNNLGAQLQVMYERGNVSLLSVLFQSTSWQDFLTRVHMMILIEQADHRLEMHFASLRAELLATRALADRTAAKLQQQHVAYAALASADTALIERKQADIVALDRRANATYAHRGMLESQIHLTQTQIQAIEQETAQAAQLVNNSAHIAQATKDLGNVDVAALLKYAESFMGVPYVWGGESPSGFDCSGFVQYIFRHFGVDLYRTSEEQFGEGLSVSIKDLQPGDLVFFTTYAPGATHVGIYIGNGQMVDAQDMGVSIDNVFNSYWGPKYLGARQVLQ